MLSEWKSCRAPSRPDPNEMVEFNVLTLNATRLSWHRPVAGETWARVRLRFGNLSAMEHHPMHIHGHACSVSRTDGGPISEAGQWPADHRPCSGRHDADGGIRGQ